MEGEGKGIEGGRGRRNSPIIRVVPDVRREEGVERLWWVAGGQGGGKLAGLRQIER
jgi:hypothetical protein